MRINSGVGSLQIVVHPAIVYVVTFTVHGQLHRCSIEASVRERAQPTVLRNADLLAPQLVCTSFGGQRFLDGAGVARGGRCGAGRDLHGARGEPLRRMRASCLTN